MQESDLKEIEIINEMKSMIELKNGTVDWVEAKIPKGLSLF